MPVSQDLEYWLTLCVPQGNSHGSAETPSAFAHGPHSRGFQLPLFIWVLFTQKAMCLDIKVAYRNFNSWSERLHKISAPSNFIAGDDPWKFMGIDFHGPSSIRCRQQNLCHQYYVVCSDCNTWRGPQCPRLVLFQRTWLPLAQQVRFTTIFKTVETSSACLPALLRRWQVVTVHGINAGWAAVSSMRWWCVHRAL